MANVSGLSINLDVIESMAAMAALEVPGVVAMAPRALDIKKAVSGKSILKPVRTEIKNGAVIISLHIKVSQNHNVKEIAEAVQASVKDKIQSMTSNAVTKVNVFVADIAFEAEEE